MAVPAAVNSNYEITAGGIKTVDCWPLNKCSYDTSIILALDQPRCDPDTAQSVTLPAIIKDNVTNHLIEELWQLLS